jgi:ubiquinone/menaquinone biosynthesis C-methylase UbiE
MKLINKIRRKLGFPVMYPSETSKIRHLVLPWCIGKGCDIGFGGDKIVKVNCDGIDYEAPYAYTGKDKVDIPCKVGIERLPVVENTYDYVYSSHLIEDFENTSDILIDFIRVLKTNGYLILVFPDQPAYEKHCLKTGQTLNTHHVHKSMGLQFMLEVLNTLKGISFELVYSSNCEIDYNVVLIVKIHKNGIH